MSITLRSERFRVRTVYEHGLAERRSSIDTAPSATREAGGAEVSQNYRAGGLQDSVSAGVHELVNGADTINISKKAKRISIEELTLDKVPREAEGEYPAHVLFPGDGTNASILESSDTGNGKLLTFRFGISNESSRLYELPGFPVLCVAFLDSNGKMHYKNPIVESRHKNGIQGDNKKPTYVGQLKTMMGKISKGMASADFNEHVRFSSLLNDGEYAIHDMSDPENPKQYKYLLSKNIDGNQMQCQATITYDDQGVPSVYIGALINGNERGMAAFMLWVLNGARGHVNDSLEKNKCTPLSEETMASFDRNGEHGDKAKERKREIGYWSRMFTMQTNKEGNQRLH